MNISHCNALIGLAALCAIAAAPLAMAQEKSRGMEDVPPAQEHPAMPPAQVPHDAAAPAKPRTWAEIDRDGDGVVSRPEAQVDAGLAQVFDQADGNADGRLTADEYTAFIHQQRDRTTTGDKRH